MGFSVKQPHRTDHLKRWTDGGMPVETMGKPVVWSRSASDRPSDQRRYRRTSSDGTLNPSSARRVPHHEDSKAGDAGVPDSVRDVVSSSGRQLDRSIQNAIEERMGDSLDDVQIHTGPSAASACEDINARAFIVGNHIAFNHGEYDPESPEGQHVLAHELAHVRQQTGGAVSMLPQEGALEIDPDERLEREAEETAQRVMQGGELGVYRMAKSNVHVQRMPELDSLEEARQSNAGPTVDSLAERIDALETKLDNVETTVSDMSGSETLGESLISGLTDAGKTGVTALVTGLMLGGGAAATAPGLGLATLIAGGVGLGIHGMENLGRSYGDDAMQEAEHGASAAKDVASGVKESVSTGIDSISGYMNNFFEDEDTSETRFD